MLHRLPSPKLQELLPDTISAVLLDDFLWRHDEIQRELDKLVVKNLYDLSRISDQHDKVPNEALVYLAKQLFGKSQRNYIRKYCPNVIYT